MSVVSSPNASWLDAATTSGYRNPNALAISPTMRVNKSKYFQSKRNASTMTSSNIAMNTVRHTGSNSAAMTFCEGHYSALTEEQATEARALP